MYSEGCETMVGTCMQLAAAIASSNTQRNLGVSRFLGSDDLAPGTLNSIYKQAGWK